MSEDICEPPPPCEQEVTPEEAAAAYADAFQEVQRENAEAGKA